MAEPSLSDLLLGRVNPLMEPPPVEPRNPLLREPDPWWSTPPHNDMTLGLPPPPRAQPSSRAHGKGSVQEIRPEALGQHNLIHRFLLSLGPDPDRPVRYPNEALSDWWSGRTTTRDYLSELTSHAPPTLFGSARGTRIPTGSAAERLARRRSELAHQAAVGEMELFDRLPPRIREALRNSPRQESAAVVTREMRHRGASEADILRWLGSAGD